MSDGTYRRLAEAILVAHQRRDFTSCMCGWAELGASYAEHVAVVLESAGALRDIPPPKATRTIPDGPGISIPDGALRISDGTENRSSTNSSEEMRLRRHLRAIFDGPCLCHRPSCRECVNLNTENAGQEEEYACPDHENTCQACIAEHALFVKGDHPAAKAAATKFLNGGIVR